MIVFVSVFLGLIILTLLVQVISNMRIVGGNELGIISGVAGKKGFQMISGGRIFTIPLLHRFAKMDLTPHTIEVVVDSAIAEGVVPLNVKATVSFAIASNQAGRSLAAIRILHMVEREDELKQLASNIIEGHLRDSIATMTPIQVMQDKDTLVAKMINVCKSDLENIGLEITTMNIADVDDHRLAGVEEPDLYIALLKRVQTVNAETKARKAIAESRANAVEQEEARKAEVGVRNIENQYDQLVAETKVRIMKEKQLEKVGIEKVFQDMKAQEAVLLSEIEAERQKLEMLSHKYEAEIVTPALAQKEQMILQAKQQTFSFLGKAEGEIEELKETIDIVSKNPESGNTIYLIENFESLIRPFAETLNYFPAKNISVITGIEGKHEPISAIHPNAIEEMKNNLINSATAGAVSSNKVSSPPSDIEN
ncbi:SPFH domain / Band 7 family protein [Saccharicrinis carchari]|uniref:SPFH domain / Band 7 family protein n=1 Tax=Saccharicrinis carchari TaxID=1168039 RepID=A0A521BEE1_SACCC|nr:flotillin family protein [Saccharicrinis carchari]SMO45442.1 SPFH domain / Band 7 family protein [Saccharicrinis carchari]